MNKRDQWVTVNGNRRRTYTFLSKVYEKEVTIDLLKEMTGEKSPILGTRGFEELGDREFKEGFAMLKGYLEGLVGRSLEEAKLRLAVEYANLFLGVKGRPPHPSESAYTTEEHLLMQKARDEVLAEYRRAGVDKVKDFREPEDHIAVELQFMAYLCRRTVEAIQRNQKSTARKYLATQKDFLSKHLASWVPQLTRDILETARVDFYKGIAKITNGFIKMDAKVVDDLVAGVGDL